MKVLYAPIQQPNVFQIAMLRALVEVAEVECVNYLAWGRGLAGRSPKRLLATGHPVRAWRCLSSRRLSRAVLLEAVRSARPDVVHMQIQQGPVITPRLLRRIKREFPRIILSHWTGDVRIDIPRNLLACAKICDFTFSASYSYVCRFREHGCNAYYLQHTYEPVEHFPRPGPRDIPAVYLGNYIPDGHILGVRERLGFARIVKEFGGHVYGANWPDGLSDGAVGYFCGSGAVYARSKIVLNANHWPEDRMYQSDRWFHAAASGAFTLSYYHPDTDYVIEDGVHTRFFRTEKELAELVRYYLAHDEERERIAAQGRAFCLDHHNPATRARALMRAWTCPERGRAHWASPALGETEAELVRTHAKGRVLDMGACLRDTSLSEDPAYTDVDGNLPGMKWRDSILKTPFHGGIFDTVALHYADDPNWPLALAEAMRLATKKLIVFAAPGNLQVPGFAAAREGQHLVAAREARGEGR